MHVFLNGTSRTGRISQGSIKQLTKCTCVLAEINFVDMKVYFWKGQSAPTTKFESRNLIVLRIILSRFRWNRVGNG